MTTEKDAVALAVLDEAIKRTEAQMPTPLARRGESTMHPCHFVSYLHDLKKTRAHFATRLEELESITTQRDLLQAAMDSRTARMERAEAEVKSMREQVGNVVREMDCDEKGKPYVYTKPSMVIWTEKWRGWVARLRATIPECK